MAQIAQLSEAEVEARFHITGSRPVAFLLTGFVRDAVQFSVQFNGGDGMFLTTLLTVQADRNTLIFDCSGSAETNRAFLQSERSIFVGRPGGIHVQFAIGRAAETVFSGSRAFFAALPDHVVRLQRREAFRVDTPRARPLQFFARLPEGALLNLPVHDISVAGIGLLATAQPEGLAPGMVLENCRFSLPDDPNDLFFSATLCRLNEIESRNGTRQWSLGLRFNRLSSADETRIQRYIVRIERERNELI